MTATILGGSWFWLAACTPQSVTSESSVVAPLQLGKLREQAFQRLDDSNVAKPLSA